MTGAVCTINSAYINVAGWSAKLALCIAAECDWSSSLVASHQLTRFDLASYETKRCRPVVNEMHRYVSAVWQRWVFYRHCN